MLSVFTFGIFVLPGGEALTVHVNVIVVFDPRLHWLSSGHDNR